ncbi:hypothetical protein MIND_00811200 [Mycena indigotica]|uniref:BTB domain-containing protein n=1 Tax=Mycena indigotica TaxID=2126181 RepID=A0A8H6SFM7_9AGAR|nr:uncharacterized protein MIND_00811200 [Mycena indigotica]KAF7298641.1 hypothetical protein MIND_00811200 [Mycena indigotica]
MAVMSPPVKDGQYYFEHGDCTFLVEQVLFKLPRFALCQDANSMFADMFAVAKDDDDLAPIPLDDSAEDFRALCWAMFARPTEMYKMLAKPGDIDVQMYLRVLDIAHKYQLLEYEAWAWMMARHASDAVPARLKIAAEDELEHTLMLAVRCQDSAPELLELVESTWLARIIDGSLPHSRALTAGELYGRRKFQGEIYWNLRTRLTRGPQIASPKLGFSAFNLTDTQLNRLLLGHALLSHCMRTAADRPYLVPRLSDCHDHKPCQTFWDKSIPYPTHIGDRNWIYGGQNALEKTLPDSPFYRYELECVGSHLRSMASESNEIPDDLASYFLGPDPSSP